jgi:hypothetical protein
MSLRKTALVTTIGLVPLLAIPPAVGGDKIDIQTPGAGIDILNGDKLLKAGDAKIKVKKGKDQDCLRLKAGSAKVKNGKIKHGECKS